MSNKVTQLQAEKLTELAAGLAVARIPRDPMAEHGRSGLSRVSSCKRRGVGG